MQQSKKCSKENIMPQSLAQCWLHLIWSTRHRWPFLIDPEAQMAMHRYLTKTCVVLKCHPIEVGGMADHVHLLCSLHKTLSIAGLVEELKKSSSKWIKGLQHLEEDLGKFYWQKGYGAFSVSQSNLMAVRKYIVNQAHHHHNSDFQDEFRSFLDHHQIPYDERYVWD